MALGDIVQVGLEITCICNHNAKFPVWLVEMFMDVRKFGWTFSAYFNLLLTALRTVTLSRPFGGVNKRAIIIAVISGTIFWFLAIFRIGFT